MTCTWNDDLDLGGRSYHDENKGEDKAGNHIGDHKDKQHVNVKGEKNMYGKHKAGKNSEKLKIHVGHNNSTGGKRHRSQYQKGFISGFEYGYNKSCKDSYGHISGFEYGYNKSYRDSYGHISGFEYGYSKSYKDSYGRSYRHGHDNSSDSKYGDYGQYNSRNNEHGYHGSKYDYDSRDSEHDYEYDDGWSK